jgi:hypothetical protein
LQHHLSPSLSSETQKDKRASFIFAVAFIVGFSERIAKDTIGRAEGMMGGGRNTEVAQIEESQSTQQAIASNSSSGENSQVIVTESKKNTTFEAANVSQSSVNAAQNHQGG